MKEATGELNMTVIVVIIVAVLVAFFYTLIWPMIKTTTTASLGCKEAICDATPRPDGQVRCDVYDENDKKTEIFCTFKG